METITNAVSNTISTANKAIFGEQNTATQNNETGGQEPVSGHQGKGTANEPFDQGNSDDPTVGSESAKATSEAHAHLPTSTTTSTQPESSSVVSATTIEPLNPTNTASGFSDSYKNTDSTSTQQEPSSIMSGTTIEPLNPANTTGDLTDSYKDTGSTSSNPISSTPFDGTSESNKGTDSTGLGTETKTTPHNPISSALGGGSESYRDTDKTGFGSESRGPSYNPNNAAQGGRVDPYRDTDRTGIISGRTGDASKAQDVIPTERADNTGAAPASGAAPTFKQQGADKPLDAPRGEKEGAVIDKKNEAEEIMKHRNPNDHSGEPMHMHDGPEKAPTTQEERRNSKIGNPGGQEHGKEPKGTGEEWVKTTGMAADGGDFDATKPGAGREADRLLEQKGIHKSAPGATGASTESSNPTGHAGGDKEEKESIGHKLKNKLHIGHKK